MTELGEEEKAETEDETAPPSSDEPVSPEEYARRYERLQEPAVVEALRAALHEKYGEKGTRDRLGATWLQALQTEGFPKGGAKLVPWLMDRAEAVRRREGKHNQKWNGMTANAKVVENVAPRPAYDPLPPHLEKVRDAAEEVAAARPIDARAYEMMKERYIDGESVRAVADKWSIPPKGYYDQTERFSKRVRRFLGKPGGMVLLFIGLVIGYLLHRGPQAPAPSPVPPIAVAPTPPVITGPDSRALGATFKTDGLAACASKKWDVCTTKLNDAVAVDPTLANDPDVQQGLRTARNAQRDDGDRKTRPPGANP